MRRSVKNDPLVQRVVNRIAETIHPRQIILFGSCAQGTARDDSDWDFLVIAESTLPRYRWPAPWDGVWHVDESHPRQISQHHFLGSG